MIRSLVSLLLVLQTLAGTTLPPETRTVFAMKTGILLRMHVIAQDDTAAMQHIKLCVRDAVRDAYAAAPASAGTMLTRTQELLPQLTQAARNAALAQGYTGPVTLRIEQVQFDQRTLDGLTIPAGEYPALMIRLGEAQGHNWWGLIDPELALSCAQWDGTATWNWSLTAFIHALLGIMPEVTVHE